MLNVLVVTFSGNKMYLSLKNTSKIYSSKKSDPILSTITLETAKSKLQFTNIASSYLLSI